MARTASVAVAGFYPTPITQVPRIAALLRISPPEKPSYGAPHDEVAVLDPCAGEGTAVAEIVRLLGEGREHFQSDVYACEMEAGRYEALKKAVGFQRALQGDAFRVEFQVKKGVGLLFLNPPYDTDTDKIYKRLEERFLARFVQALAPGGVLVFLVPGYALSASAATLGRSFDRVSCYRFAGTDYDAYKQVALFAVKRESDLIDPDPRVVAEVEAWAADASALSELPENGPVAYAVPNLGYGAALDGWKMRSVDVTALLGKHLPWHETTRGRGLALVSRVLPDIPIAELLHRTYEVATPPRPAHIAAGLAAGLFNGQRIEPDDPKSRLPPLLVKGVFDREWRTIEEKQNKKGETTSVVQAQAPKLVVTVLDLESRTYRTLESSDQTTRSVSTVADLLARYGRSLGEVMERQCRILYDPREESDIEVAPSARKPFAAQAHAVRACVRLLRERAGRHPVLLGEIGGGKTLIALLTAKTVEAQRVLVICPPHLLGTWKNEVALTTPEMEVHVLESVSDVEALPTDRPFVAVLSRETAKLGHGVEPVGRDCPKCGMPTPAVDLAKKRARCEARALLPADGYAEVARDLALLLRPHAPGDPSVRDILRSGFDRRYPAPEGSLEWQFPPDLASRLLFRLGWDYVGGARGDEMKRAIAWVLHAIGDPEAVAKFIPLVHGESSWNNFAPEIALLAPGDQVRETLGRLPVPDYYGSRSVLQQYEEAVAKIGATEEWSRPKAAGSEVTYKNDKTYLDGVRVGSLDAALRAFQALKALSTWQWGPECGEHLYQAVPEPRRFPLAKYIVKRHPGLFDFLVIDEGHEYASEGSAQERAAHRLTTLGLPTVFMTGSVMNGYAASLFTNLWALSPEFRQEFDREDLNAFCDRYGYRKRILQDREDGEVIAFGSHTDRVERSERDAGDAPGILPLFLFRHLLPSAVTIHKADLRIDLPPCTQDRVPVEPDDALLAEYKRLLDALKRQITADRFEEGLAGKLFGQLSELPSFLDRATADVGNVEGGGAYEVRYPESVGGNLVAKADLLPASTILPKERWLLDKVEAELAEGRNVMVFGWHLGLLPRLARLITAHTGEKVPILWADKVATGKRQAWIDREIVKKNARVMVANPVAIQTGLNNLIHFHTEIWHENPACNPIVYRQAIGRIDRIGQKKPTRVLFAHYDKTLQTQLYDLLIAKVAVSTATDGLDAESALIAAGMGSQEMLAGLSIGKQLWAMIQEGVDDVAPIERARRRKAK